MDMDTPKYQYQKLHGLAPMRLVRLHSQDVLDEDLFPNEAFSIEFVHVELLSSPAYEAVSYAWGDSRSFHSIYTVNREHLYVTESLLRVLKTLRPRQNSDGPRLLWIDQLCIDQANNTERFLQVRRMRDIFKNANRTLLMIHSLGVIFDRQIFEQFGGASASQNGPDSVASEHLRKSLALLLDLHIFTRAWIYQEIVYSKNVELVYGQYRIAWSSFAATVHAALDFEGHKEASRIVMTCKSIETIRLIINDRKQIQEEGSKNWELLLLQAQGLLKCSDPRDHIMALVRSGEDSHYLPNLYGRPVEEGYRDAAASIIQASKSLDILAGLQGVWLTSSPADLPSWAPDWTKCVPARPLCLPGSRHCFRAAASYPYPGSTSEDPQFLLVVGKVIAEIKSTGHMLRITDNRQNLMEELPVDALQNNYLKHAEAQGRAFVGKMEIGESLKILLATVTAGFTSGSSLGSTIEGLALESVYSDLHDLCVYYRKHKPSSPRISLYTLTRAQMSARDRVSKPKRKAKKPKLRWFKSHAAAMVSYSDWAGICSKRHFAFGEGREIGLVPYTAKVGDKIVKLHGSRVPVVLRRLALRYRVVGQCYWHGCMYGEKVNWKEEEADWFKLA